MGFRIYFKGQLLEKFLQKFGKYCVCYKIDFTNFYSLENPEERINSKEFWEEYARTCPEEVGDCEKFQFFLDNFEPGCVEDVY